MTIVRACDMCPTAVPNYEIWILEFFRMTKEGELAFDNNEIFWPRT